MPSDNLDADVQWDDLVPRKDYYDVQQFTRGGQTRTYRLRPIGKGAELWRLTEALGEPTESIRETHFNDVDEFAAFLEEMGRALKAGGWTEL